MHHAILASATEAIAAGFGTAVALVVLGTFLLRWYRMRQEFALMKLALEKGVTPQFMPSQPQWLVSLRQGMLIAALGMGLVVIGGIGWSIANRVPQPSATVMADTGLPGIATETSPAEPLPQPAPPGARGEERPRPRAPRPAPPPRDPALEAWHRAREQINVCMAMVGGGIILILLGLVRITFVPVERRLQQGTIAAAAKPPIEAKSTEIL